MDFEHDFEVFADGDGQVRDLVAGQRFGAARRQFVELEGVRSRVEGKDVALFQRGVAPRYQPEFGRGVVEDDVAPLRR